MEGLRFLLGVVIALASLAGCASPVASLWPPEPGEPGRSIVVSVDSWHAMIAFPLSTGDEPPGPPASPRPRFEEWGYAERGWYLEGRQGLGGILRAMLWPSPGVVEVVWADQPWAERTPDPPAEAISFELTEVGYLRLREHLASTRAATVPVAVRGASRFYAARDDYDLLHTCHQYAALALRAAGLPVWPWLAFSRASLLAQLRRASRMREESRRASARERSAWPGSGAAFAPAIQEGPHEDAGLVGLVGVDKGLDHLEGRPLVHVQAPEGRQVPRRHAARRPGRSVLHRAAVQPRPSGQQARKVGNVKAVEAMDDSTVRFVLKEPRASFLAVLTSGAASIVSPTAVKKWGADYPLNPVGTGPFRYVSWQRGQQVVLEKNPDYWRGPVKFDRVVYRPIVEDQARLTELLTGAVDMIVGVPPDFVAQLEGNAKVTLLKQVGAHVWYLGINNQKKPFDDKRVRQALNYAVNKDAIVNDVLKGTGSASSGPVLPGTWGADAALKLHPSFDLRVETLSLK